MQGCWATAAAASATEFTLFFEDFGPYYLVRPKCFALKHILQKNMSQLTISTGKRGRGVASTSASAVTALSSSTDLASLFECPVCFDYVLPPILQCQSGHLVCSNCRPKLTCCPTCRGPLGKKNTNYNHDNN